MEALTDPTNITFLSYGNTCQIQAARDMLVFMLAVQNLSMLISAKAATFEEGFDPCRRWDLQNYIEVTYAVPYSKKCHFYTDEIYQTSKAIYVLNEEDLIYARALSGKDPQNKIFNIRELLKMQEREQLIADNFYQDVVKYNQYIINIVQK
ncbi:hypothetical protein SS50377_22359 [Spironucleus salmonicida]|uniref:Uncharacterized protein n=1 Tax=Spironucleus salmonicida TaxID=348837 RepID=V6LEM2_9EUKA|nr:hypothetical protein SS50377_22359 [Spironucleus salmonicida]|eukprot:EST42146.1 Hypothetical protein SS50377_18454 [Spironucleus salmonicida]